MGGDREPFPHCFTSVSVRDDQSGGTQTTATDLWEAIPVRCVRGEKRIIRVGGKNRSLALRRARKEKLRRLRSPFCVSTRRAPEGENLSLGKVPNATKYELNRRAFFASYSSFLTDGQEGTFPFRGGK